MKTLYISDLDGTLLQPEGVISPRTAALLNPRVEQGLLFTLATARSEVGIGMLNLDTLDLRLPLVLMNGVLLYDFSSRRILHSVALSPEQTAQVLACCLRHGKRPCVYREENAHLNIEYTTPSSEGERVFLEQRLRRFPEKFRQVETYTAGQSAVYFSMQDCPETLEPLCRELDAIPEVQYAYYKDVYMDNNWYLEIYSVHAGKDKGAALLRERLGAEQMVVFGDNTNDIPLLKLADTACVVANGLPQAKAYADVCIGASTEDGVAAYVAARFDEACAQENKKHV